MFIYTCLYKSESSIRHEKLRHDKLSLEERARQLETTSFARVPNVGGKGEGPAPGSSGIF